MGAEGPFVFGAGALEIFSGALVRHVFTSDWTQRFVSAAREAAGGGLASPETRWNCYAEDALVGFAVHANARRAGLEGVAFVALNGRVVNVQNFLSCRALAGWLRGEEHVFLGRELGEAKNFSEHTAMMIDEEIRVMLDDSYQRALRILGESRDKLELLTRELLEKEVLNDKEIYQLMDIPLPDPLLDSDPPSRPVEETSGDDRREEKSQLPPDVDPGLLGLEGS